MNTVLDSVLYFPTIEFTNDTWLKTSLLFWDRVYRIVPRGYTPHDSDEVKKAVSEDLVRSIYIEEEDIEGINADFYQFINHLDNHASGLTHDLNFGRLHRDKIDPRFANNNISRLHRDKIDPKLINNNISRLHRDKIDSRLYELLKDYAISFTKDGWINLPSNITHSYMLFLADSVSRRRNLAIASDNRDAWVVMPYFMENGNFDDYVNNFQAEGFYSSLIFRDLLPASIENIKISEIIKFNQSRQDERTLLRNCIEEFCQKLQTCKSRSHLRTIITDFEKDLLDKKTDFKKSMGFLSKEKFYSLFTVGLPISLGFYKALDQTNNPFDLTPIISSVLIGAVASYLDYSKKRKQSYKNSRVSYLVDIDKNLHKKGMIPNYSYRFNEFIND